MNATKPLASEDKLIEENKKKYTSFGVVDYTLVDKDLVERHKEYNKIRTAYKNISEENMIIKNNKNITKQEMLTKIREINKTPFTKQGGKSSKKTKYTKAK